MDSPSAFRITCSAAARDIGGQRKQQDNGFSTALSDADGRTLVVAAVFDGHGARRGEMFSALCVSTLAEQVSADDFVGRFINNPENTGREIFAAIAGRCFEANKAELVERGAAFVEENGVLQTDFMSMLNGGSTGTVLFVTGTGTIHTFNVGDSDAWFVSVPEGVARPLCACHSPDSASEYCRVHATWPDTRFEYHYSVACGRPRNPDGDHVFPARDNFTGYYAKNINGDMATLLKVGASSLAMTRAFGDEPLRHGGLIAEPDYKCVQAGASGVLQIATDGFWDNIRNSDIAPSVTAALQTHGFDADALNTAWLEKTRAAALANFGASRDNMWAYTLVLQTQ